MKEALAFGLWAVVILIMTLFMVGANRAEATPPVHVYAEYADGVTFLFGHKPNGEVTKFFCDNPTKMTLGVSVDMIAPTGVVHVWDGWCPPAQTTTVNVGKSGMTLATATASVLTRY